MSEVTVTMELRIETDAMVRLQVDMAPAGYLRFYQEGEGDGDTIIIDPAAIPALIATLQAMQKDAENE